MGDRLADRDVRAEDKATVMMIGWTLITCFNCGVQFCVRAEHQRELLQHKRTFHCPNGHPQSYTENEEDRLRRQVQRLQQEQARILDEKAEAQRAAKNALTSLKREKTKHKNTIKRAAAGVCLECHRTFSNLANHMRHVHGHKPKPKEVLPLP